MRDLTNLAISRECPTCDSGPFIACVTRSGRKSSVMHSARLDPFREAFSLGYEEALKQFD